MGGDKLTEGSPSVDDSAMSNIFLAISIFPYLDSLRAYNPQSSKSFDQKKCKIITRIALTKWIHIASPTCGIS